MTSAMPTICDGTTFNYETDFMYKNPTKPRVNDSGGKNVGILNRGDGKGLNLSSPLMLTWGVNEWTNDGNGNGKKSYDMSLQFPKEEYSTPATSQFLENMQNLENQIKADAIKYSREWFNKSKMTPDVVDALFTPMLRYPKDPETGEPDTSRAPTLKVKLPFWEDEWKCEIYSVNEDRLYPDVDNVAATPMDFVTKASNVALIMQSGGIWFANGKFGTTWKLVQTIVQPKATLHGRCHLKLGEDDRRRMLNTAADNHDNDAHTVTSSTNLNVDDSDDEDTDVTHEVSEAVQQAAAAAVDRSVEVTLPPSKKKKKVVRRKKVAETSGDV
jgi:hypothetical protein